MPSVQDNIASVLAAVRGYLHGELDAITTSDLNRVLLGNIAQAESGGQGVDRDNTLQSLNDAIVITLVRTEEDPTRKNQRNYRSNPLPEGEGILYRTPPIPLNLHLLITANHANYVTALELLSHVAAVFQHRNRLTEDGVPWPASGIYSDQSVKFSLLSPTYEEENHLWSMLGGKQLPSLLYLIQSLNIELLPDEIRTGPPIREIILNDNIN